MKLTEQDKQTLRDFGHPESDMRQLCEAARRCKHTDEHGNRITAEKARKSQNRGIGSKRATRRDTLRDTLRPVTYVPRECSTADYW